MKYCNNCGESVDPADSFCGNCGHDLGEKKSVCPECGNEVKSTQSFCAVCGAPLKGEKMSSTPKEKASKHTVSSRKSVRYRKKKGKSCLGRVVVIGVIIVAVSLAVLYYLGDPTSEFNTGPTGENRTKHNEADEARKTNSKLLDMDDVNAGDKYLLGIEVAPDAEEALKRYRYLAEKGDHHAMMRLSEFYEEGIWVEKNPKKAMELLKEAADAGSVEAQWKLEFLESQ